MDRRTFLQSSLSAAGLLGIASPSVAFAAPPGGASYRNLLVLIELQGGNDGLNTVVPYADPAYYALRPKLAIARDDVLQLSDRAGLHPALEPLLPFWRNRQLAVLQGIGYAAPNLSHFRSIEIWDTASSSEAYLTDGGPTDSRIRFYRDIALMRGHLLVGQQLIALELWDEALPHFLHPTEELYGLMEKYIKMHNMRPFQRELQVLSQAVKAKRKSAYAQALKVVDQRLDSAFGVARKFMNPLLGFTARSAAEVLKVALSEYEASQEDGRFVKPVE